VIRGLTFRAEIRQESCVRSTRRASAVGSRSRVPPVRTVGGIFANTFVTSGDCGIVAGMGAHSEPDLDNLFETAIDEALNSLPADLRAELSNVAILVEEEPPDGQLLGRYSGAPRAARGAMFGPGGMLPSKVSIFRGPITRLAAGDAERLGREIKAVVLHSTFAVMRRLRRRPVRSRGICGGRVELGQRR